MTVSPVNPSVRQGAPPLRPAVRAEAGRAAAGPRVGDVAYLLAVNASVSLDLVPVVYQLLSGAVDAAACRRLNMSPRTFSRRVADLLEELGVATRFQGGAECGRRAVMALASWRALEDALAPGSVDDPRPGRLLVTPSSARWTGPPAAEPRAH